MKVHYEDLAEKVYKSLKEMILTNELKPGQKLIQESLSEELGVSRTPILAAFSKLEKDMLIELIPRHGAYVRACEVTEFLHFADICLRLEPLGARGAAENATDKNTAGLLSAFKSCRQAAQSGDTAAANEKDHRFHMEIMELSGNLVLARIISSCHIMLISNLRGLLQTYNENNDEHTALFEAIARKDAEAAEKAMYEHIENIRKGLENILKKG